MSTSASIRACSSLILVAATVLACGKSDPPAPKPKAKATAAPVSTPAPPATPGPALTLSEIWNTMDAACTLSFVDPANADARAKATAGLAVVGVALPPLPAATGDAAKDRSARGQYHGQLALTYMKEIGKRTATRNEVMLFSMVQHDICVVFHAYEPDTVYFQRFAGVMEQNAMEAGIKENAAPVVALLRANAPAPEVHAAVEKLLADVRAAAAVQ